MKVHKMILTAILALVLIVHPIPTFAEDDVLAISSQSAVLIEQSTGKVLYEKNSHESLPPASITKIMTLLLIYESQKAGKFSWDDMVTVSEHAASMGGSQVFLEPNEQQTAANMTKCIAIASANDAAVAMAEFIGGSEEGFVKMMNEKAAELGMKDTVFKNACGLDIDGHVSSAYDIALMSRELMKNFPEVQKYTTTWMDTITHKTAKGQSEFGLTNTNKLIKWYNGATGLKTGSTGKAKYCLSGTAQKDGMNLIAVVMAAPDNKARFQEAMKLLNYGFAGYEVKNVATKGGDAGEIPVTKGKAENVPLVTADDVSVLMKKGTDQKKITEDKFIKENLQAPFEKGENAGEVVYMLDGKEVGRTKIVTSEGVEKAAYTYNLGRIIKKWAA